jgi:Putative peptidoglycan binding domain
MSITNTSNKLIALATGVAVALALMGAAAVAPAQASALTQTQIQAIVSLLSSFGADQATINNVTAALNGQTTTTTTTTTGSTSSSASCPALTRDLSEGSTGSDVMALQQYLNSMASTQIAASGPGSPGMETQYFGSLTQAAVINLQTSWGITPAAGYVGPITRAAIASHCGNTTTTTTTTGTVTGGAITVSAGTQPVNTLAPQGAARVPFTTFTISNGTSQPVTVNSVTVQRTGLGVDQNFSGIVLLDQNGLQIGTAQTLNSNHQANIGNNGFTVPANSSAMFTVAGNIATGQSTNGQVVSLEVVAVNTSATVSGALPITGASQTINNTLTLGTVSTSTSAFDPGVNQTENIGDTGVRFSGIKFTAGSAEDLKLYSIRWRQVGTAGSDSLANVVTVANGTSYPATVDSTGKYYTTTFPGGILIPKGNSLDVYVQGDLVGSNSAGQTVEFNIDKVTDVYFVGQLYGYGVTPTGSYQPWFNGYTTTIEGGTVTTITKSNSGMGAAQNVAINVQNQPMGGFTTNFAGEPVTVSGMTFTIATSTTQTAGTGNFTNVSLVDQNGTVVAGPQNAVFTGTSNTVTFTDTVTFPVGVDSFYLEGQIPSGVTGGSFQVSTTPGNWTNPTGQTTGNDISLGSAGTITMNSMSVQPGTLTVSYASTPSSQNVVAGASQFTFANIDLDASQSGENVRLSSVPVYFSGNTSDLSGCQLWNGTTALNTSSRVINSVTGGGSTKNVIQLDNVLTVPKGTATTLSLACNISSAATSSASFEFLADTNTSDWSVTGATSGTTITPTLASSVSGTMTVQTATLALTVDSSSPASTTVSGGSTGQTVAVYNLLGSNDTITLNKIGMTLDGSANPSDVTTVWLYDSSNNLLGSATFGSGQSVATSTLSKPLTLTPNTNTKITVKADVADVGIGKPGVEGDVIAIDPNSAQGIGSTGTINSGASGTTAGMRLYNSYPTFTYSTSGNSTLANGVNTLLSLSVSADPAGDVGLYKLTFTIATSGVNVVSPLFTGPNGNVASSSLTFAQSALNNPTTLTVFFDSTSNTGDATVPAGTTKTYTLQGTVSGITGSTGGTVSTALEADTSANNQITVSGVKVLPQAKNVTGNLVWSPLATTSLSTSTDDWTNGYALTKGCFASVGLATNCTANVVSK